MSFRIKIISKTEQEKEIECEKFDFDSGFLKITKPTGTDASEIYVPCANIVMIANYGPVRVVVEKKEEKE